MAAEAVFAVALNHTVTTVIWPKPPGIKIFRRKQIALCKPYTTATIDMRNGDGQIRKVPNLKSYEYYVTS